MYGGFDIQHRVRSLYEFQFFQRQIKLAERPHPSPSSLKMASYDFHPTLSNFPYPIVTEPGMAFIP